MKASLILAMGTSALAAPLTARQFGSGFPSFGGSSRGSSGGFGSSFGGLGGSTANDLESGSCKDVVMIFARGSTEIGNMGSTVGPATASGLKSELGADKVAVQGVPYAASVGTNALPGGTDSRSKQLMVDLINKAHTQCPDSAIVVGGYSQGAAVTHRAVEGLDEAVKSQIAAAFMYGDTQNTQDRGQIPNFPKDKTIIICNTGDAVCRGILSVLPAHLAYQPRVGEAVDFVAQKVQEWESANQSGASAQKKRQLFSGGNSGSPLGFPSGGLTGGLPKFPGTGTDAGRPEVPGTGLGEDIPSLPTPSDEADEGAGLPSFPGTGEGAGLPKLPLPSGGSGFGGGLPKIPSGGLGGLPTAQ